MNRKPKSYRGISRIDQVEKRTHGFFVRLTRKGKQFNAFFADKRYGGKGKALKAAQKHYEELVRKHGAISRKDWAQIPRRKSASGIVGVRRAIVRTGRKPQVYWVAHWSPRPGQIQRKMFSVKLNGEAKAKALAVKARKAGVRSMAD